MQSPIHKLSIWTRRISKNAVVRKRSEGLFQWLVSMSLGRQVSGRVFKRQGWYYRMYAQVQRKRGDDHGAFRTLMLGQRFIVNDYRLHLKLSEIYRDNGDVLAAHTHLKLAEALRSGYSTIRRLTFETDHGMFDEGSNTMARVLGFSLPLVHRHLTMLNRVSIYYPEHAEALQTIREKLKARLLTESCPTSSALSEAVDTAISNRWLGVALDLRGNRNDELHSSVRKLLDRLEGDLGAFVTMLEIAWKNESSGTLTGMVLGRPVPLDESGIAADQRVELFIPTPFFANPDQEKPTYETIRRTFVHILEYLSDRSDLLIIPRLQLNWKQCFPKTRNTRIISYHTSAPPDSRRLHIQESPFAGYCSFDHAGFAGFASIATNHAQISGFVAGISDETLEQNQRGMFDRFVTANVSKYGQPSGSKPIPGPYVFVALQIPTDIVSHLAWMSGIELLESVVDHYRGSGVRVVVKRHPFCGSMRVQKCIDSLAAAGEIIRTDNSIHSIVADARVVLTVNSGVGLEALIQGKTVVVSGACDYSYAVKTVKNRDELHATLGGDLAPDHRRIRELLYYYVHRFAVPAADADLVRTRLEDWLGGNPDCPPSPAVPGDVPQPGREGGEQPRTLPENSISKEDLG